MTVLNDVRFSYCAVFEPRPTPSNDLKYSVSVLVPKTNKEAIAAIKQAITDAKRVGVEKSKFTKVNAAAPTFKTPLRDGDTEHDSGARGPEYKGMFFFNAASNNRPGIVGPDAVTELMDADEFYSGVWGHIDVNFYPFSVSGSRGIAAGLNNLMKVKDDDRLDGRQSAASAFEGKGVAEDIAEDNEVF